MRKPWISKRDKIGNYYPDLVARKGDEVVVVEVKAGKFSPDKRRKVAAIGDYVRTQKNYKFLVVLATPSKPKKIDIPNMDQLLSGYLLGNFSEHLRNKIFAYTEFKSVTDVVLNKVTLTEEGSIAVEGSALVEIELRYSNNLDGSIDDNSIAYVEVFPCTFSITLTYSLDKKLIVSAVDELTIDNSDSFEE